MINHEFLEHFLFSGKAIYVTLGSSDLGLVKSTPGGAQVSIKGDARTLLVVMQSYLNMRQETKLLEIHHVAIAGGAKVSIKGDAWTHALLAEPVNPWFSKISRTKSFKPHNC